MCGRAPTAMIKGPVVWQKTVRSILRPIVKPVIDRAKHMAISSPFLVLLLNACQSYSVRLYRHIDTRHFRWLYCLELTRELSGDIIELGVGPRRFLVYCARWLQSQGSPRRYWGYRYPIQPITDLNGSKKSLPVSSLAQTASCFHRSHTLEPNKCRDGSL